MGYGSDVAKLLRKELKVKFPKQKFSVRTGGGSMSTAINVGWSDGVAEKRVKPVLDKFAKIDYDRRSGEILGGGNTFVFGRREVSDKHKDRVKKKILKKYGKGFMHQDKWQRERYLQERIWEQINETNFK